MENLAKKSRHVFYSVLFAGIFLISASVYFLIFLSDKIKLVWLSVMGMLETICGCANHFVFSNHPYLFTFLIISFLIILGFVFAILYKAVMLRKKTSEFIDRSLQFRHSRLSKKLKTVTDKISLTEGVIELKNNDLNVFCYGLFKPSICISSEFVAVLSDRELEAVLLHEQQHILSHDPLRFYIIKIISSMFFFVPFLTHFSKKFFALSEMAADDWAVKNMGEKVSLARVVYKTLEMDERMILKQGLIVPLFNNITEERVNKLVDDKYVFDVRILSSRLLMFLGVFIFSISVYSFLILTGDNVIAMHDESMCSQQEDDHDSCTMKQDENSCEMEGEKAELEHSVCEKK